MSDVAPLPSGLREQAEPNGVEFSYSHDGQSVFRRTLIRAVEQLSGQPKLKALYEEWANAGSDENPFAAAMRLLQLNPVMSGTSLCDIPRDGGLLIVANHPFGIIDGLTLGWLGTQLRSSARIMTHALLCRLPELKPYLLPVDFAPSADARKTSGATRREVVRLLEDGECVVIFPGGSIATANRPLTGPAIELPWHPFVGRLALIPGVTVLPVHVSGQNSRLFQIASHLSYPMRVALIFNETRRLIGRSVGLNLGQPLSRDDFQTVARDEIAERLRSYTVGLGGKKPGEKFEWPSHISW